VGDEALLADAERVGDAADIEVEADGLEGRQQHLQHEKLVDRERTADKVALARGAVVRIDLRQHAVPVGQVVEDRVVAVARRGATEDRLEQRRELPVRRRVVAVGGGVVGDTSEHLLEAALHGQAHGVAARGRDVLLHHRLQQRDHRVDARHVRARIRRQVGPARRSDRVGKLPDRRVEPRRQHLGPEVDPGERGREVELRRRQHLDARGGFVRRVDLVQAVEVDRVVA
jgi:hypothetical protein